MISNQKSEEDKIIEEFELLKQDVYELKLLKQDLKNHCEQLLSGIDRMERLVKAQNERAFKVDNP